MDVIYEILMLIFGILAIFGNIFLLYCIWKGTPKYMKNNAVLIAHFVLVQLGSSITITIIVPRLCSSRFFYIYVLQGPIAFFNLEYGNKLMCDLYYSFLYTKMYLHTFNLLYNSVLIRTIVKNLFSAIMYGFFTTVGIFACLMVIFSSCQILPAILNEGRGRYGPQCYETNEIYHTTWYGTNNCFMRYLTSYIALGLCAVWIPELMLLMKFHPAVAEKSKVFVTKKERMSGKSRVLTAAIVTFSQIILLVPSLCLSLFYMTLENGTSLYGLVNFIVFFLPLLSDFLNPIVLLWGIAPYREYFLYSICKFKPKDVTKSLDKNESRINMSSVVHN